jgi:predicted alpha/beta superfamily hydrolase
MNKAILAITAILFSVLHLNAQYTMTGVPPVKQDTIHSDVVGEDYYLQITLPLTFSPTRSKYPVLFYLDAYGTSAGMNELAK